MFCKFRSKAISLVLVFSMAVAVVSVFWFTDDAYGEEIWCYKCWGSICWFDYPDLPDYFEECAIIEGNCVLSGWQCSP